MLSSLAQRSARDCAPHRGAVRLETLEQRRVALRHEVIEGFRELLEPVIAIEIVVCEVVDAEVHAIGWVDGVIRWRPAACDRAQRTM